jgi:hypothetical protein
MEVNLHFIHIFYQILTNISNMVLQLNISSMEINYFSCYNTYYQQNQYWQIFAAQKYLLNQHLYFLILSL